MLRARQSPAVGGVINAQIAIGVPEPELPLAEFARRMGRSLKSVQHDADLGLLPISNNGKRNRSVNMIALYLRNYEEAKQYLATRI